ncbi:hypothetical protein D9M68_730720 [compost metagenome]
MAAGATRLTNKASWKAPESMRLVFNPSDAAARSRPASRSSEKAAGGMSKICLNSLRQPAAAAALSQARRIWFSNASMTVVSGCLRSTVNVTEPGMAFTEPGSTANRPTVNRARGSFGIVPL